MALYSEVRSTIKSGDLLAWTHRKWGSWYDIQVQAVRIFTQSEYCHVGVAWVVGGRVFVIEAVTPKVRIYPLSKQLPFYLLPMGGVWTPEAEEFALAQVGLPYSKWNAIESIFRIPKNNNMWQCAQLTASIASFNGVFLSQTLTPSGLVEGALDNGSSLIVVN